MQPDNRMVTVDRKQNTGNGLRALYFFRKTDINKSRRVELIRGV